MAWSWSHHFSVVLSPVADADQREILRQHVGVCEVVERRHHQALGEVAAGAEDHHGARIGGLSAGGAAALRPLREDGTRIG